MSASSIVIGITALIHIITVACSPCEFVKLLGEYGDDSTLTMMDRFFLRQQYRQVLTKTDVNQIWAEWMSSAEFRLAVKPSCRRASALHAAEVDLDTLFDAAVGTQEEPSLKIKHLLLSVFFHTGDFKKRNTDVHVALAKLHFPEYAKLLQEAAHTCRNDISLMFSSQCVDKEWLVCEYGELNENIDNPRSLLRLLLRSDNNSLYEHVSKVFSASNNNLKLKRRWAKVIIFFRHSTFKKKHVNRLIRSIGLTVEQIDRLSASQSSQTAMDSLSGNILYFVEPDLIPEKVDLFPFMNTEAKVKSILKLDHIQFLRTLDLILKDDARGICTGLLKQAIGVGGDKLIAIRAATIMFRLDGNDKLSVIRDLCEFVEDPDSSITNSSGLDSLLCIGDTFFATYPMIASNRPHKLFMFICSQMRTNHAFVGLSINAMFKHSLDINSLHEDIRNGIQLYVDDLQEIVYEIPDSMFEITSAGLLNHRLFVSQIFEKSQFLFNQYMVGSTSVKKVIRITFGNKSVQVHITDNQRNIDYYYIAAHCFRLTMPFLLSTKEGEVFLPDEGSKACGTHELMVMQPEYANDPLKAAFACLGINIYLSKV